MSGIFFQTWSKDVHCALCSPVCVGYLCFRCRTPSTSVPVVCRTSRLIITMRSTCLCTPISRHPFVAILTLWFIVCSQPHSVCRSLFSYLLPCLF